MQTKKLRRTGAFLLSLLLLTVTLALPACAAPAAAFTPILTEEANAIDAALSAEIAEWANKLEADASAYEASGEILKDESGNDVDMTAYIAELRERAVALRGVTYLPYELAILDDLYARAYIGVYRSVTEMLPEMVEILAYYGVFENITDEISGTEALLLCYTMVTEDPYDGYVDRETAEENAESPGTYVGIGVSVVQRNDGYIDIIAVNEGGPAEKAGIRSGDILTHVDGTDIATIEYDEVLTRVRGEAGTQVTLTLKRGDTPYTVTVTRAVVSNVTVTHKMLETGNGRTGYVRISEFSDSTFGEFVAAIEALEAAGAENFVFDVRSNPGGRVEAVLGVLEYILPETEEPLVRCEYKDHVEEFFSVEEYLSAKNVSSSTLAKYEAAKDHELSGRIAVLCDEYTASGGELFASCLMDFERAELFGSTTYGKGIGQTNYVMSDYYAYYDNYLKTGTFPSDSSLIYAESSYLVIPAFYYSPPISENYHGVGVVPHHTVTLSEEASEYYISVIPESLDAPLQAAIAFVESEESVSPPTSQPGDVGSDGSHTDGTETGGTSLVPTLIIAAISVSAVVLLSFATYLFIRRGAANTRLPAVNEEEAEAIDTSEQSNASDNETNEK